MIKELHEKLRKGETTSAELTLQCLDSIEKKDQQLHCFLEVFKKSALEQAKKFDQAVAGGEEFGLLGGVPCAIKDNMCMKGTRTTASSRVLENYSAPYDATVVEKLRQEKAVFLGKTNLDEFAMGSSTENSAFGVTRNPYDAERVAGGSSGGSAACVAAGLAPWALGSDTGGSIRQPASLCGIVGLKPTYGRVSRYGLIAMASSYDQIGPLAKTVEDAAIVFDAICGNDSKDNTTIEKQEKSFFKNLNPGLEGKKIGIAKNFFGEGLSEDVRKTIEQRVEFATSRGAEIVEIDLPSINSSLAVYYIMQPSEVSSNLARFDGIKYGLSKEKDGDKALELIDVYLKSRQEGLGDEVKRRVILGTYALSAGYYDAYYKKAQKVRELIKKELAEAFKKVDVILSPTSPTPAFKVGEKTSDPLEMYLADIYTVSANVAMVPAISVPAGMVAFGEGAKKTQLPVGLQLMGKWWDEQNLLNIAAGFELE